jgi:hypothetical protein
MPFCPYCGTPVKEQHMFCPSCGKELEPIPVKENGGLEVTQPQHAQQASAQPPEINPSVPHSSTPAPTPAQLGETVKVIIPNLMVSKSLGRVDTYNLIVTDRRSIFAKLTNEIVGETVKMRRAKAEAEGKGFFGKWKAQMQGFNTYADHYLDKTPDQALNETPGNYAVDNSLIRNIRVDENDDDDGGMTQYNIEITTPTDKLKFKMQYDPREHLRRAYGAI